MLRDVLKRKKKSAHSDQKASTSHWSEGLYASSEAMPLEPRIMLDGAGLASAVDALSHELAAAPEHAVVDSTNHSEDEYSSAAHNLSEPKRNEVVIVDATVEGYQQLLTDLIGEVDQLYWQTGDNEFNAIIAEQNDRLVSIYAISEQQSGMESVSNILASHNDIDAVHILSHGTEQGIVFNDVLIDIEALESNVRQVSAWGDSLTDSGDILLYGCETGVAGAEVGFVQTLSELTDADVAASNDLTGHADAGGDWDLEVRTGNIETDLVPRVEAQAAFAGVLSADAATTLDIPANGFINENFEFCLIVDNVGTDPGYAPYVNLFIEPGVEINDASLLGSSLSTSEYTWDAVSGSWLNSANNPITDHPVNPAIALPPGPAVDGTVWTVIELPFGSFVPSQPPAKILFDASIDPSQGAILGQPVGISAQTGFQFGEDPYNNPVSDPPLLGPLDSSTIVPTVIEVDKESYNSGDNPVGMESEQGTGPNNPITFEITVDIADGQTVDNILLSDVVPTNVHYLGSLTVAGSGAQVNLGTSDATIGVHNSNQLSVSFDSVTGTIAEDDIVITYQGYIPDVDVNGDPIVDPITGVAPDLVENTVQVDGEFSSIPVSDTDTDEVIPASLAIQKSVDILDNTGSPAGRDTILPGDLLEWTLKYQISDYFSLENFEISDNYSDGQLYVPGSETVEIFENSNATGPSTIAPANVTLGSIDPATGLTEVRYDMSSVIAAEIPGSGGVLDGDLVDGTQSGKTWVHVKFRTEVQETFQYPGLFGGDPSVDVGDILSNDVEITAEVEGTGNVVSNSSSESVSVDTPVASKSVYAINLDTDEWDTSDPEIAPGQSITYRITIELPTTDVENLVVTDYLPLPIFEAASSYAYTGLYSGVDNVPAPGEYGFGPLTDVADFPPGFFNTTGTALDIAAVSVDNSANSVTWDFDAFDQTNSAGGVIDLLFTTATANVPFDDGLSITNQAQISYDNTNNPQEPVASIVQVEPLAPMLEMTKGVVAVDSGSAGTFSPGAVGPVAFNDAGTAGPAFAGTVTSPGIDATPIDSDVSELDAGDIVRFAITIENTGGFVATDITVNDAFPSQLSIPAGGLNMTAALGDGTPLTVVGNLFTAGGVADPAGVSFQQGGAEAVVGKGREDSAPVTDGSNILVLTYDLVVDDSAIPLETFENSAELLTFAALDGGVDYTDGNTNSDWSDVASVSTVTPAIEKDIVSSGIVDATNPLNRAVAGEYITYSVTVTLPEGTVPAAQLRDRIDSDTQFDQLISITPSSADITTDLPGGFAAVVAPPSGTNNNVYLDLGNIVNTNTDNSVAETLTFVYRVYVKGDVADNTHLRNRAYFRWDTNDNNLPDYNGLQARAPVMRVITPDLEVDKAIVGIPPTDVGDPISYEITVQHTAASDTTAYNVSFSDTLPVEIGAASIDSVVDESGAPVAGFTLAGNTITNADFTLGLTETVTITVSGTVTTATAGAEIINTANIDWTTLDPTVPDDGLDAIEPTFTDDDSASFVVNPPVLEKSIISTGINTPGNDNTEAVNGEYVMYRLLVTVPEGTTPTAEIIDALPANVTYDPSFTPTIVLSSPDLSMTNSGVPPTVTAAGLSFDFGTITNSNNSNPTPETITIEYRAYVEGAAATDTPTNVADFIWDIDNDGVNTGPDDGSQTDSSVLDILEPELEVVKSVSPATADAGDTVQYTMVIQHTAASDTDAYDASFNDVLPVELVSPNIVSAVDSGGATVPGFTLSGNTIANVDYDLPLGETITLTVTGVVDTAASASTTVSNTASIDWDTLGDDTQGNQAVEGVGAASDDADFTIASPLFNKSIVSSGIDNSDNALAEVVAGEFVTYELEVIVPEGTTPLASITDTLDPDLLFDPSFTITAVASADVVFTGSATVPSFSGSDVIFDLGTVTNSNTDNSIDDTITITYRVYADSDVVLADSLPNSAELAWDSDNDGAVGASDDALTDTTSVTVIAPELQVEKTITTMPADAGDTVVYRYEISHTAASNAAALDASFSDLLPVGIDAVSVTAVDGGGAPVTGFVIVPGSPQDTISNPDYDLPEGESIVVTVTGTLNTSVSASSTVTNVANIDWDTLGDDSEGNQSAEATGNDSDSASFIVASPSFSKGLASTGIDDSSNASNEVVAGEFVTYSLEVVVPEGTTPMASITDTLDPDLILDPSFVITAVPSSGVSFTGSATAPVVSGSDVTFDIGTITNTNTDNTSDDTITITYRVYADSDVVLADNLPNSAEFVWDADNDGDLDAADGLLTDTANVTVISPELQVEKTLTTVPTDAGDTVVYRYEISHTAASNAAALDASFSDLLPAGIDAVGVTAVDGSGAPVTGFVIVPGSPQDTISNPDYDLPEGESIIVTVTGILNTSVSASTTVTNTANIDWDSLGDDSEGVQAAETTGSDSDSASFIVASPTFEKSIFSTGINANGNDNQEVVAGEYVEYRLEVVVPEGTTPMAQITDTLHADLLFDNSYTITAVGSSGVSFTGPATMPTVTGSDVTFDLGTITNTNTDDTVDDTVTILYRVYADSDVVSGATLNNDATLIWDADNDGDNNDNDGVLNDTVDVTVISPELLVDKSVSLMPSDVGDSLEYTIVIRHTDATDAPLPVSGTSAHDVTFSDVLPPGVANPAIVSAVDSTGGAVAGFVLTGNTISHAGFDLLHNDTVTLTISGEADASIVEGDLIDNIADITWSTLDDGANDGYDAGESGGSDSDNATFSLGNIEKTILNTGINDASNDNGEVVTGEYVTYQLSVEIPQGTSALAEIEDTLDAGLVFDQANGVTVVPSSTNLSTSIAPGDFSSITSSYDATGNVISIDLGDITNTAPAGTVETLTITYRVYVDNDMVNADIGATLNNAVDFKWDIDGDGSNDGPLDGTTEAVAPEVEVIGPELQITKDITTVPSDAGDVVTYEMVISHTAASQAAAFDATFTDTLPSEISGVSIVSAVDSGGAAVPGFTVSGNTVSHADYDLPLGETITLTVTGTVNTTASASTTVDNVATIDWDTLGDDGQGNQSVEDGGSANDNDSFVVASPTFEKLIAGTGISDATNDDTEVVAGEYITYDLVVTVPEGTTPMAQITDTLHSNLIFDATYSVTAAGSAGVSFTGPATSPTVSGSDVTFDLGTITNTNTDDTVADTVTITYRAYADSDVARGDTLNNDATLIWDADNDGDNNDGDGVLDDTTDVNVITPSMQVDKSVTLMPSDIGDLIEYTMVIRHTDAGDAPADPSDTGAYDVTFTDVLPAGLINPSVVSAVDSSGTSVAGFGVSGNTVNHAGLDMPLGEFITLTVQAEAGAAIVEGDLVDNIADITWTTLDDDANDGFDAGESGGSDSDNATFSLGNIEKSILNTGINDASNDNGEVVTGEYVTYQLSVEIPQGTSALAEIEDTLDTGLVFDQANGVTVVPSSTNLSTSIAPGDFSSITSSYDATGNVISIDLGDITNTAPAGTVETLTITYRVYVDNDMVNADIGATLNNAVDFKWDIDGDGSNDGPLDGTTEAVAPEVEVIGPELQITKDITTVPSDAGDVVTYEMVISHTAASQAAAFDATFTDTLPSEISGVSIVSAVDSGGAAVPGFTVSGNTVSHADYDLPLGETITLTVTGTVNTTASASTTVDNVATIDWDTLGDDGQGNQSVEDGGSANDNDSFVVASPTFEKLIAGTGISDATNDDTEVVAGEYITYDLVVTVPEGTTPMAQITDTLHSNLIFDATYSVTAAGSAGVSFTGPATSPTVSGSDVTFDLGTITNTNTDDTVADTVTITYRAYADSDVARGDTLNNDATLIWDADNDGDNNDGDGVLDDTTDVNVITPSMQVDKSVTLMPSDIGDLIEYTMVIRHTDAGDAPADPSDTGAYDVTFTDVLPAGLINPSVVSAVDSSGTSVAGFGVSGNTVNHAGLDMPLGEFITLTVQAEAGAAIVEGDLVDNIADITWTTLDDDANDGFDAGESGGSDSDNATFSLGNIEKSILNTGINDASNDNGEVVTGEYVTYQLSVEIPQGTSALAEIEDTLDTGLVFDQANGVTVVPSSTNLSTSIAPGDFSSITSSYDATGNVISIDLGDITNTAPAGTVETLTITYRVYVDNDMVNADIGATLNNAVDFKWDIDGDGSNDGPLDGTTEAVAPEVKVIGPELQITKDITTVPSDAGDVVTYEMVISHTAASQAAAFDATFTDTLPSEISGVSIVSAVDSSGTAVPGFTVSGNTVSHADYDLPLGETITLTITGTVNTTASASTTVNNIASIDWDTLGDDSQGNQSVEDGGSASDNDSFVVASPTFEKSIFSTGINANGNDNQEVVAGEYIEYQLAVVVPEGTTPMAQITDTLHTDLLFDSSYTITAVGSSGVSFTGPATMPTVTGSDVTFDLGTITNTNTDDTVDDTVTILYRVYADSDVVLGATLNNNATLIWDADNDGDNNDGDGVLNDSVDVSVIAPQLLIDKTVSLVPSDIGDPLEYTIVVRHTDAADTPLPVSGASAYDVTFSDVLPAGITNPAIVSAFDGLGAPVSALHCQEIPSVIQALISYTTIL